MKTPSAVLPMGLFLLIQSGVSSFETGNWAFGARWKDQLDLSKLEDVLVKYIPEYHTIVVPLGDWSSQNLKFLCDGMLWVSPMALQASSSFVYTAVLSTLDKGEVQIMVNSSPASTGQA